MKKPLKHTITEDYDEMCKVAAHRIAEIIREKAEHGQMAVLGLATGGTPVGVYKELVRMHKEEGLSFENVVSFNLDEYIVDAKEHPDFFNEETSYHGFMEKHLFSQVAGDGPGKMKRENIHIPNTMAKDLGAECHAYEAAIKTAGGIDLQLLGIGVNGHIGFCEPHSPINGKTSVVTLTPETVKVNQEKFGFSAPTAISMGLGTILKAREILLIANGKEKALAIRGAQKKFSFKNTDHTLRGLKNSAAILQGHNNAHFVVDKAAAHYLEKDLGRYQPG